MECQRTNEETELTIIAIISIQIQTVKEFTVVPIDVELHVRLHIVLLGLYEMDISVFCICRHLN